MKLMQYLVSLQGNIELSKILEDLGVTRAELTEQTLPGYAAADMFNARYVFKSKWVINKKKRFENIVGVKSNQSFIDSIHLTLQTLVDRLDWLELQFNQIDGKVISVAGITYPKAMLLRLLENIAFMSRYARKLLLIIYCYEAEEYLKDTNQSFPYSKAEMKLIEDQFDSFLELNRLFTLPTKNMVSEFNKIPEIEVDISGKEGVEETIGVQKLNPLKIGFIPYTWNPIYHINLAIAEWQVSRYEASQNERQALELRLLQLKMAKEGQSDASTDKLIEQLESRIQKINYKLTKMEKANA